MYKPRGIRMFPPQNHSKFQVLKPVWLNPLGRTFKKVMSMMTYWPRLRKGTLKLADGVKSCVGYSLETLHQCFSPISTNEIPIFCKKPSNTTSETSKTHYPQRVCLWVAPNLTISCPPQPTSECRSPPLQSPQVATAWLKWPRLNIGHQPIPAQWISCCYDCLLHVWRHV